MAKIKKEKFTETSTQNPSEPRRKDISRKKKEAKEKKKSQQSNKESSDNV